MAERLSGAILAAGCGERLRPVSGGIPKPLVEINGKVLLIRQLHAMLEEGIAPLHVIINTETYQMMHRRRLFLPAESDLLVRDTANSMESLLGLGERIVSERFLLRTVDAIIARHDRHNFVTVATKMMNSRELRLDGVLGVVRWRGDKQPLFATIAADGTIGALGAQPAALVTAGIYLLSTAIFRHGAEARRRGLDAMRRFLGMLLERRLRFAALELEHAIDLDEPEDLPAASAMLADEA